MSACHGSRVLTYRLRSRVRSVVFALRARQKLSHSGAATDSEGASNRHLSEIVSGSFVSIALICFSKRFQPLTTSAMTIEMGKRRWKYGYIERDFSFMTRSTRGSNTTNTEELLGYSATASPKRTLPGVWSRRAGETVSKSSALS